MFFQEQMHSPTFQERSDLIAMEWDPRNPKLRLSVFAYLVDNEKDISPESIDEIVQYVSAEVAAYAENVANLETETANIEAMPGLFEETEREAENPYGDDPRDGGYA